MTIGESFERSPSLSVDSMTMKFVKVSQLSTFIALCFVIHCVFNYSSLWLPTHLGVQLWQQERVQIQKFTLLRVTSER